MLVIVETCMEGDPHRILTRLLDNPGETSGEVNDSKVWTSLKADGLSYKLADVPPLPPARVTDGKPFQFTGVHFAGPLRVKFKGKEGTISVTFVSSRVLLFELCI